MRKNNFKMYISILLSFLIVGMSVATPFFTKTPVAKGVQTGSPPTITISNSSSQSVPVEKVADYKLTVTNDCYSADYINIVSSNVYTGWSAELLASNNSTPLSDHNSDEKVDTGLLNPGESYTFHLHVTPSDELCNSTQDTITVTATPASGSCGSSSANTTTTAINTGILVITKAASPTEAKVGDTVTWDVYIKNTGGDPIGNVDITDTLGSGSTYNDDIDFNGNNPDSGGYPDWTYNHLPAGADYTVTFTSTVTGCSNIDNSVSGSWGNNCQTTSASASVKLIPTTPNISFTPPDILVPYCGSTDVDIPITNNGDGVAYNFKIKITTFPSIYNITTSSLWLYDPGSGEFTYTGGNPSGTIEPQETIHLTFTVTMPDGTCDLSGAEAYLQYTPSYNDPCGNAMTPPHLIGHIDIKGRTWGYFSPARSWMYFPVQGYILIEKDGPDPVDIGQTGLTYTLHVTYYKGECSDDSVTVDTITDTVPEPFIITSVGQGGSVDGQKVEWSNVTLQDTVTQDFTIKFNVTDDPCYAGHDYVNDVDIPSPTDVDIPSPTNCCGCSIPVYYPYPKHTFVNDPYSAITDSSKVVDDVYIEIDCSTDNNSYKNPSDNSDSHNNRRYTVEYDFNTGTNAPSSWNGIIFRDQLNNNQFTNLDIANIVVEVDCGSGFQQVTGWSVKSYVPLEIDLGGLITCPPNTGAKLRISFTARARTPTQDDDPYYRDERYDYVDWSTLELPGFPRGCSGNPYYYEGIRVLDYRADLITRLALPSTVEKCNSYDINIYFYHYFANVDHTDLTINLDGFEYVAGSTTYSDNGGSWCSGAKGEPTVSSDGKTLTWDYSQINEISEDGYITIRVKKDCTDSASITGSSNYKDNCGNDHTAPSGIYPPGMFLLNKADLNTKITPQKNFAYEHTVDWKVFVKNNGDGTAREITLTTTLGSGLSFNSDGCYIKIGSTTYNYGDSAIGWPSDGATGTLAWDLNDLTLSPSQQIELYFKTDVNSCDENNLTVDAYSNWCTNCTNNCEGCAESNHDTGQVFLPDSYALVVINSAEFSMCSGGSVEVEISNPSQTHIYNVSIDVYIPKYVSYSQNSSTYSYNGGSFNSAGEPEISSISGGDYDGGYELVWDKNKISELQDLSPNDKIVLRFNIESDSSQNYPSCNFLKNGYKKVKAYANFAKPCDINNSTETSNVYEKDFSTHAPDLSMTKKVVKVDGSSYTGNSHWFPKELGSTVVFEVDITNNGDAATVKTNFADLLKGNSQHPLDYQSARYSYDEGTTWHNIQWNISDGGEPDKSVYIWNNIEHDLGSGIGPGKMLKIQITATVDSACSENTAYNYAEVWTGCSDLGDIASDGSNLKGNATSVSGWNDSLTANCPIYQAKFARNKSHDNSWNLTYSNNVADDVYACEKDVQYEITFTNNDLAHSAVTIYGPITIYDLIPVGTTYVTGSSVVTLPDNSTQNIEPVSGTETLNGTQYTKLSWSLKGIVASLAPGKTVKVDFKLDFGNCSDVNTTAVNRQRLQGYNCKGSNSTQYSYPNDNHWGDAGGHWVATTHVKKPNMVIQVSVDKSSANQGDTVLYMIHVKNTGDGAAKHFTITDTLPSGLIVDDTSSITDGPPPGWGNTYSWMSHSFDSNTNTITITWQSTDNTNNNEFPAGADTTVSFEATVNTGNFKTTSNCITFTDDCCYKDGINVCAELIADLEVTKTDSHSPDPVIAGQQLTYTITVTNNGPSDAQNVVVTETYDSNFHFSSATPTADSGTNNQWTFTTVAANETKTITITGTVDPAASGTISNSVSVSSDTSDPDTSNNSATQDTTVNTSADLEVTKTDSPDPVIAGQQLTYTITVTNNGPSDAQNVTITDNVPSELQNPEYSTDNGSTWNAWSGSVNIGTLTSGASKKILIRGTVDSSCSGTISNTASVSSETSDPKTDNNSATQDTTVNTSADLEVTKTDSPDPVIAGQQLTYTITVTNNGPSDAQNVVVTETYDSNFHFGSATPTADSGTNNKWTFATIAAGDTKTITITGTVDPSTSGTISNSVSVSSDTSDPDTSNNSATQDTTVNTSADIQITKTDNPDPVIAGQQLTYTITVKNHGPSDAQNVVVTETYDSNFHFGSATPTADSGTNNKWTFATIAAGDTETITITGTVDPSASGTISNSVSVTSDTSDPDTSNNSVTQDTTVNTSADLSLTKDVSNPTPHVGDNVTFTITVTNSGPSDATNVQVTDQLPDGYTYVSSSADVGTYDSSTGVWTVGSIANGSSATLNITAKVNATGDYTNTAEITASDQSDPDSTPNNNDSSEDDQDSASTTPVNSPLDPPMGYKVGTNNGWPVVQWKQVWINSQNGTHLIKEVTIIDPIPANATYVPNSLQYEARGSSTTDSCYYDETHNWIVWKGTMGPDPGATNEENAQNEVIIKFKTTVTSGYAVENQAKAYWDQNNDGKVDNNDPNVANNTPVVTDDPATTISDDPTVVKEPPIGGTVYPVNKFILILPWLLLFLSLAFMAYLLYKKRRLFLKK